MKNNQYNSNGYPYKYLWGCDPTKPSTRSFTINKDYCRSLPKPLKEQKSPKEKEKEKEKSKNKDLLERIKKLEFWFT